MDEAKLKEIAEKMRGADYLSAYDGACQAAERDPADPQARYFAVLSLARAGATSQALKEFLRRRPDRISRETLGDAFWTDCQSLLPRLAKDVALAAPVAERPRLLRRAVERYRAAYARTRSYYPGINAATLLALSGRHGEAAALASELLTFPDLHDADNRPDYWALATRAEALLILRRWDEAARSLELARGVAGSNYDRIGTTRRQLVELLGAMSADASLHRQLLSHLRIPRVAYYIGADVAPEDEGTLAGEVAEVLERDEIAFAVGTLWGTGALVMAEQVLARNAELHLVLPFSVHDFRTYFAKSRPAAEMARRERCIAKASKITEATADGDFLDPQLVGYASRIAAGLAQTRSRHLSTDCIRIEHDAASRGGRATAGGSLHALHVRRVGLNSGSPARRPDPLPDTIFQREVCAFLYGDVRHFSRILESRLPDFWSGFMAKVAEAVDERATKILYRNTWGDAVFLVMSDLVAAADLGLAVQERAAEMRRAGHWAPMLRIALHHGPVFRGPDPIQGCTGYFGTQVSRVARVEPKVPPGAVYVTEPFAAILATEAPDRFESEYVGLLQLAKNYGEHRIYRLTRRLAGDGGVRGPEPSLPGRCRKPS